MPVWTLEEIRVKYRLMFLAAEKTASPAGANDGARTREHRPFICNRTTKATSSVCVNCSYLSRGGGQPTRGNFDTVNFELEDTEFSSQTVT